MKSEGNAGVYTGGTRAIPVPTFDTPPRRHAPPRRATGLDWDALRPPDAPQAPPPAPTKACRGCRASVRVSDLQDGWCGRCSEEIERRRSDDTRLGRDLAELEVEDPKVRDAADQLDDAILHPDDHIQSPPRVSSVEVEKCATPAAADSVDDVALVELHSIRERLAGELEHLDRIIALLTPPAPAAAAFTTFRRPGRGHRATYDVDDVARRYKAGETAVAIAADVGTSASRIRQALADRGIPLRDDRAGRSGSRPKDPDTDDPMLVAEVRRLYLEEQHSQAQIAEQLGIGTKHVQNIMSRHSIPARPPANKSGQLRPRPALDDRKLEAVRRYQAGESTVALGQAYGVTPTSIGNWLKQAGVPRRPRGGLRDAARNR